MKIMAIHGLWCNSSFWDDFKEYFKNDIFLTPEINYSKIDYEKLSEELRSFKPDILIGHSYGGYISQRLLEKENSNAPEKCILIAPVGPKGIKSSVLFKIIMRFPRKSIKWLLTNRISIDDCHVSKKLFWLGFPESYFNKYNPRFTPEKTINALRTIYPLCKKIKKPIQSPTLIVSGGHDLFVSKKDAQNTARFHHAHHIHLPNYGHMLITKQIAQEIEKWINKTTI